MEADRETVRNDRQLISTQFENANKLGAQYINMIGSVLKTVVGRNTAVRRSSR